MPNLPMKRPARSALRFGVGVQNDQRLFRQHVYFVSFFHFFPLEDFFGNRPKAAERCFTAKTTFNKSTGLSGEVRAASSAKRVAVRFFFGGRK